MYILAEGTCKYNCGVHLHLTRRYTYQKGHVSITVVYMYILPEGTCKCTCGVRTCTSYQKVHVSITVVYMYILPEGTRKYNCGEHVHLTVTYVSATVAQMYYCSVQIGNNTVHMYVSRGPVYLSVLPWFLCILTVVYIYVYPWCTFTSNCVVHVRLTRVKMYLLLWCTCKYYSLLNKRARGLYCKIPD